VILDQSNQIFLFLY